MVHLGWNINPRYRHLLRTLAVQLPLKSFPCFFIARWWCPEKLLETQRNWPSVLGKCLWLIPRMIALVVNAEYLGRVCTSKWASASTYGESESNYTELITYKTRESSHQGVFALPTLSLMPWLCATLWPNSSYWTWWKSVLWTPSEWILCLHNKIPNKMSVLFTSFGMVWKLVWKQHGGTLGCFEGLISRLADVIPWTHQPRPQTFVCLLWCETSTRPW